MRAGPGWRITEERYCFDPIIFPDIGLEVSFLAEKSFIFARLNVHGSFGRTTRQRYQHSEAKTQSRFQNSSPSRAREITRSHNGWSSE
jgi:hypothetical protein